MTAATKERKLYKYVSLSIAGLNFLIPYNSFQVIRLVSTFKIQKSKVFFIKKGSVTYKIFHILRYLQDIETISGGDLQKGELQTCFNKAVNRPLVICILWRNNQFGLVIDKYQRRFYDFGGMIIKRSTPFPSSSLISGRFRFRSNSYLILDPINLITDL